MKPRLLLILLITAIAAADYLTKGWALSNLAGGGRPVIAGFFDLTLGFNAGISFGLLAADGLYGYVVLIAVTLAIAIFFAGLAWRAQGWAERVGFAAIVGGAAGNLIDRLRDGLVTDFLDFHAVGWHFPTFNLADVAISMGVALLGIAHLL
jgi:signal peptidase II